jgi:hypothetical protein
MTDRATGVTRRGFVAVCGGGVVAVLGGCAETSSSPPYQDGQLNQTNQTNATERTAQQTTAAEAAATTEPTTNAVPLESLVLESHEYVLTQGYKGPVVQGTVENTGNELVRTVEVRVRVYNASGAQLGRYIARTGDLAAGTSWQFEVILLASPSEIADYEIAVLGVPD